MSFKLPDIVFTVKLEPFFNILDTDGEILKDVEIEDLEPNIENVIKERIDDDHQSIISQTISFQYKVAAYKYDENDNIVSIDFILTPDDIRKRWIPESNNTGLPEDRSELLTTIRDDVVDQLNHIYGDLADETWKRGRQVFLTDNGVRYLIDLRLLSSESFLDWSNVGKQNRLTSVGGYNGLYYKKYMIYKLKYLSLKKKSNHKSKIISI